MVKSTDNGNSSRAWKVVQTMLLVTNAFSLAVIGLLNNQITNMQLQSASWHEDMTKQIATAHVEAMTRVSDIRYELGQRVNTLEAHEDVTGKLRRVIEEVRQKP